MKLLILTLLTSPLIVFGQSLYPKLYKNRDSLLQGSNSVNSWDVKTKAKNDIYSLPASYSGDTYNKNIPVMGSRYTPKTSVLLNGNEYNINVSYSRQPSQSSVQSELKLNNLLKGKPGFITVNNQKYSISDFIRRLSISGLNDFESGFPISNLIQDLNVIPTSTQIRDILNNKYVDRDLGNFQEDLKAVMNLKNQWMERGSISNNNLRNNLDINQINGDIDKLLKKIKNLQGSLDDFVDSSSVISSRVENSSVEISFQGTKYEIRVSYFNSKPKVSTDKGSIEELVILLRNVPGNISINGATSTIENFRSNIELYGLSRYGESFPVEKLVHNLKKIAGTVPTTNSGIGSSTYATPSSTYTTPSSTYTSSTSYTSPSSSTTYSSPTYSSPSSSYSTGSSSYSTDSYTSPTSSSYTSPSSTYTSSSSNTYSTPSQSSYTTPSSNYSPSQSTYPSYTSTSSGNYVRTSSPTSSSDYSPSSSNCSLSSGTYGTSSGNYNPSSSDYSQSSSSSSYTSSSPSSSSSIGNNYIPPSYASPSTSSSNTYSSQSSNSYSTPTYSSSSNTLPSSSSSSSRDTSYTTSSSSGSSGSPASSTSSSSYTSPSNSQSSQSSASRSYNPETNIDDFPFDSFIN